MHYGRDEQAYVKDVNRTSPISQHPCTRTLRTAGVSLDIHVDGARRNPPLRMPSMVFPVKHGVERVGMDCGTDSSSHGDKIEHPEKHIYCAEPGPNGGLPG